jgi:hypothetical protein
MHGHRRVEPADPARDAAGREHKLIIVFGKDLEAYERVLLEGHVPCRVDMRFVTEADHVHSTCERYV